MASSHRGKRITALAAIAAGLIVFAALGVWMSPGGNKGYELGKGARPYEAGARGEVGTTGPQGDSPGTENSGPAASPLTDPIDALTGPSEVRHLIGRRVELQVPIGPHINDVAFWTRYGGDRLLVVLSRDTRDGRQRQSGDPSANNPVNVQGGLGEATVSGRIEPIPSAEAMHSWGLTNPDREALLEHPVYLRVDRVTFPSAPSPQP